MGGFTKLFSDIVDSSIWEESPETCKVWVTLLALCDADGFVRGSEGWLAGKSRVSLGKTVAALNTFQQPDIRSRTPDNDGRRIERVEDGWIILNYLKFREKLSTNPKTIATRERVRKHRERYNALRNTKSVTGCYTASASVYASGKESEENQISHPVPKSNGDAGKWLRDDLDAMFKRNGRAWTYAEEHALFMVTASPTAKDEWNQIKSYHSKLVPKDKPFFPQSAISLLESWSKLLDKAAVYEVPKSPEELKRLQNMREMIR